MMRSLLLSGLLLSLAPPAWADDAAGEKVDFATQVEPIFAARCYKCHGEKRALGGFRMHNAEELAVLVEDGIILEGDSQSSSMYDRLILPADDELRMPKGGDPLTKEQIELIKRWIDEGAELTSAAAKPAMKDEAAVQPKPASEKPAAAPSPAAPQAIAKLVDAGASVVPLFSGSPLLSIGFPSNPGDIDDATVDLLLEIAPNVAWLDISGSNVTDAGAMKLAGMPNLQRLHLEKTKVTDACIGSLSGLAGLEYLNLYGTFVTDAALAELEAAPTLEKLYVWQTNVTFEAAKKLQAAKDGLKVNLGWDHPGVIRERLTNELAAVVARKTKAEVQAAEAEQALADAKVRLESATSREAELMAELEALDNPKANAPAAEPKEAPAAQPKKATQPKKEEAAEQPAEEPEAKPEAKPADKPADK